MKTTIILGILLTLASCGKKINEHHHIIINDDRLTELENRVNILENRLEILEDAQLLSYELGQELRTDLDALDSALERVSVRVWSHDQTQDLNKEIAKIKEITASLKKSEVNIKSICGTSELLLESKGELFAVISSITNNGNQYASNVHLGKLVNGSYKLTDGSNVTFNVVDGSVRNCSNML